MKIQQETDPKCNLLNKLNEGLYWKGAWANATYYDKGDIVRGTINTDTPTFVFNHTHSTMLVLSINQSMRPGAGVDPVHTGNYYGGPENDVISAQGDLLIYGPQTQDYPIGRAGQLVETMQVHYRMGLRRQVDPSLLC